MAQLGKIAPKKSAVKFEVVERRRAPRKEIRKNVMLRVEDASQAVKAQSVDISESGAFIATDYPPEIGTLCLIELFDKNDKLLLRAEGKIVRHAVSSMGLPGVGVFFTNVQERSKDLDDELARIAPIDE